MFDSSNNKKANPQGTYPQDVEHIGGQGGAGFNRVVPFPTVDQLKNRWLFGIPLTHPLTKQTLSDDTLKDILNTAASKVELDCNIDVFPVRRVKKIMFEQIRYAQGWNNLNLGVRNIKEVHEISIRTANSYAIQNGITSPNNDPSTDPDSEGTVIYNYPLAWINMSNARKGMLDMVPLQTALNGTTPGGVYGGGAAALFSVFTRMQYVPGFFFVRFTSGFDENSIPNPVSDLIATYATLDVLSALAPLNKYNSQSIGLDSASQSISTPGNQIYALRAQELTQKAADLKDLIRNRFSVKIYMDAL